MKKPLFHLAFPVHNIKSARQFYIDKLGFEAGRESRHALIMNLAGNQIVAQLDSGSPKTQDGIYPRHFGLIFTDLDAWQALRDTVVAQGIAFFREPTVRYRGKVLEHSSFFIQDPSGNLLEFKFYTHESAIFGELGIAEIGDENR